MKATHAALVVATLFSLAATASAETTGARDGPAALVTSPVSVGGDIIVEAGGGFVGKPFVLDGTKSQDDGVVRTYLWRQVGGPTIQLSSSSSLKPTFTPTVAGTYVFELSVIDSTGLSSVAQKSTYIVQHNETDLDFIKKKVTPSIGDPDFDLLRATQPPVSIGDVDRDGALDKTVPTVSNEGRDRAATIGDPDFDLLNISLEGDDLEKFRRDVSSEDVVKKVTVRGWDPKKKEEIIGRPERVKTSKDLKVYVEAVALNDVALRSIKIKENSIEVQSREQGKLFWFIPVEMSSKVEVMFNPKEYEVDRVKIQFPWWHIFVKKAFASDAMQEELSAKLDASIWQKVDNSEPPDITRIAQTLQLVSNVLKIKHDTVKNSINNIR